VKDKVVLYGDSVFDNEAYAGRDLGVIDFLEKEFGGAVEAKLKAVDGSVTQQVIAQLELIPDGSSHLFISTGGNDALGVKAYLDGLLPQENILKMLRGNGLARAQNLLHVLTLVQQEFRNNYRKMVVKASAAGIPLTVCTIYDLIPTLEPWHRGALSLFNDVIIREATSQGASVLDLRAVCTEEADYAECSPIEPSAQGSRKIAAAIRRVVEEQNGGAAGSRIYI
jgi:hypothetical protein